MNSKISSKKWIYLVLSLFLVGVFSFISLFQFNFPKEVLAEDSFSQTEFENLQNGLNEIYEKYGRVQKGEEIVVDKTEVVEENGEQLISMSSLNVDSSNDEKISLATVGENYEIIEDDESYTIKERSFTNRIIVSYDGELEPYKTEVYAEGLGYHIFQYETQEATEDAYNFYNSLAYVESVSYDNVIVADDLSDYNALALSDDYLTDNKTEFLSWGAKVTGVDDYISYLDLLYDESDLPTVYVAVFDSGVNTDHVILKDRVDFTLSASCMTGKIVTGKDAVEDDNGHGSHTAGIIADQTKDNVKIISLKVLDEAGEGNSANILVGINYLLSLKEKNSIDLRVINMSLGIEDEHGYEIHNTSLENAVRNIYYYYEIISVVSAGNLHNNTISNCPANVEEAVVVSALTKSMEIAVYSNYGATVDFAAPGSDVKSAFIIKDEFGFSDSNFYSEESGTSMAAPHVTAVFALLFSSPLYREYTNAELIAELKLEAVDLGDVGKDDIYGYGCIDISNFGLITQGEIEFSVQELEHTEEFELTLSYNTNEDYTIYYTLDETLPDRNSYVYSGPIKVSKTTKIIAVAYVSAQHGDDVILKSNITEKTYYFNNIDLDSNFEISGGVLTKYNGILTTLDVQDVINGQYVFSIGDFAFSSSNVENLILPYNCRTICEYAFYCAENLKTISLDSVQVIEDYAFAYCHNLKEISLPSIKTVGNGAFNGVQLDKMTLGGFLQSFGEMQNFSVEVLECYTSENDEEFLKYGKEIKPLNMALSYISNPKRIITKNDTANLVIEVYGKFATSFYYGLYDGENVDQTDKIYTPNEIPIDEETYIAKIEFTFNNLEVGSYTFYFYTSDVFGNSLDELSIEILVLPSATQEYYLVLDESNCTYYIDGAVVEDGYVLYDGVSDYELKIEAEDSYFLETLQISNIDEILYEGSEINQNVFTTTLPTIKSNINITAKTKEIQEFLVSFDKSDVVKVLVNGGEVNSIIAKRNQDLTFQVVTEEKYKIDKVLINGKSVNLDENNSFTITSVLQDCNIQIEVSVKVFEIYFSYGAGGNISANAVETAEFGENRSYKININDGYEIDYVLVNGEKVEVENNVLSLNNITKNLNIILSFKEIDGGLDENTLTLIILFSVIFGIMLIWISVEIILKVKKDKKYNYKKNYSKHF